MGNGMIREIDLHDSLNTRIDKIEVNETNVANVTSQLSNLENNLQDATAIIPTVAYGMNNVIKHDGEVSVSPKFTITGKTLINLFGKDGNCEDASGSIWGVWQCTTALDSTNKVFGTNSLKVVATNTMGNMTKNMLGIIDKTKYYCLSAYLKNGNLTNGFGVSLEASGDTFRGGNMVTDTTKFVRSFVKIQPSDLDTATGILLHPVNFSGATIGQYGYVDGVMLEEITQAQYNDVSFQPSPYVDSYSCLQNPYIEVRHDNMVRNGNGEEGIAWWKPIDSSLSILSIINGTFQLVENGTLGHSYYQIIDVKMNTDYYISGNTTGVVELRANTLSDTNLKTGTGTFNTGNNTQIKVHIRPTATGTGTVNSIILIEGTTPPTSYKSCRVEKCVLETKLTSDDSITYENGEVTGKINWKHKTLFGKDYDWILNSSNTGYRIMTIAKPSNSQDGTENIVKYDGKLLSHVVPINALDQSNMQTVYGLLSISAPNTDTGWAESIPPNNDEVKCFMNGWKALTSINSGTRYLAWLSIVDGSVPSGSINTTIVGSGTTNTFTVNSVSGFTVGDVLCINKSDGSWATCTITSLGANTITTDVTMAVNAGRIMKIDYNGTTNLINWCKNNVAPNYEGYQVHYKLATPEVITDGNCHIHGDITKFDIGENYLYLDTGIVLGETVNPLANGTNYYIGYNQSNSAVNTPLKYKDEFVNSIYKNSIYDFGKWGKFADYVNDSAYYTVLANFDTSATYTVDYKILSTQAPTIGTIGCSYTKDVINAINKLQEEVNGRQIHDSVLDNIVDLSMYETTSPVISYSEIYFPWVISGTTGGTLYTQIAWNFKVEKKAIPNITINNINLVKGSGYTNVTNKFKISGMAITTKGVILTMYTEDLTTVEDIRKTGVYGTYKLTADCKGRI